MAWASKPCPQVASTLACNYGLHIGEADLQLLAQRFPPPEGFGLERLVDVDLFLDALRGEVSVGRGRLLDQLYSLLQRQARAAELDSLGVAWIQSHLMAVEAIGQDFTSTAVLAALPMLRRHGAVTRATFRRWQLDVLALVAPHELFLHFLQQRSASIRACKRRSVRWKSFNVLFKMLSSVGEDVGQCGRGPGH